MPRKQVAPISKQIAKKVPKKPTSRAANQTGIVTDKRPHTPAGDLDRAKWNIKDRQTRGDWKT